MPIDNKSCKNSKSLFNFLPRPKTLHRHLLLSLSAIALAFYTAIPSASADSQQTSTQTPAKQVVSKCSDIGSIWWNELLSPTTDGLGDFYSNVIGWNKKSVDVEDQVSLAKSQSDQYTIFKSGNKEIAGVMKSDHVDAIQTNKIGWFVYIQVANVQETVDKAEQQGGTILQDPIEIAGKHKVAVIMDPAGNIFGVVKPANC